MLGSFSARGLVPAAPRVVGTRQGSFQLSEAPFPVQSSCGFRPGPVSDFGAAPPKVKDRPEGFRPDLGSYLHVLPSTTSDVSHAGCFRAVDAEGVQSDLPVGRHLMADHQFGHSGSMHPSFLAMDGAVLHRAQVVSVIKWLVSRLGLDLMQFSSHSLHKGGATSVTAAGLSEATIQQLGSWRSSTWWRYIQMPHSVLQARRPVWHSFLCSQWLWAGGTVAAPVQWIGLRSSSAVILCISINSCHHNYVADAWQHYELHLSG